MKLSGKVALVTGAQQGIGASIAKALAGEGADVAVTWLDDLAGAEAVVGSVLQAGRRAHLIRADVAKLPDIEAMIAETAETLGAPDILVNNAGVYPRVKLLEMRESDWDYVLDINLKAGCFGTIAFAKALIAAGKPGGAVVNLASSAIRGAVRGVHYSASKGGVVSMTRALALELAHKGVTVNAVCPGYTETELLAASVDNIVAKTGRSAEQARVELAAGNPQRRLVQPHEVADAVLWLCGAGAASVTGQAISVSGGEVM